ncbi:hypothetical protein JR316_0004044 [Psilocybe cubensis]|uniref:Uncharacterized protein n=1 Tax=Psilocybe cubensis TaxID=181762 RepID=A0ACB8HA64_PSICU|nr:hypothetical protein JR316_0004044 [Psilocybe cubensis]KAH9484562.1 hypothetical protein JR316_0004044 [Psilocybe cubensis]
MDQKLQESHCTLGDVGVFNSDGGFDVFFNIFMTMEENLAMDYDPPSTFVPLELTSTSSLNAQRPTPQGEGFYFSNNFTLDKETGESVCTFESIKAPEKPGGAILVLPEGCTKQFMTRFVKDKIEAYLGIYAESWYDPENYSNKLRALPNGSLQLIRTCYRSNSWVAAVLPTRRYMPGMSYARLRRSATNPRCYEWDDNYRKSIIINTGSSKMDAQDLQRTIAVEVYSIYHYGPQIKLISSRTSTSSRRSRIAQSFSTITQLIRRTGS